MFSQNVNSVDGVYWMFYSGTSAENQSADSKASDAQLVMRPGLAMSQVEASKQQPRDLLSDRTVFIGLELKDSIILVRCLMLESKESGMHCSLDGHRF